jgi:hypothetical protein
VMISQLLLAVLYGTKRLSAATLPVAAALQP